MIKINWNKINHSHDYIDLLLEKHTCELPHTDNGDGIECEAFFPRVWYNVNTGICEDVIYGGCGETKNNFETKEECEKICGGYKRQWIVKWSN